MEHRQRDRVSSMGRAPCAVHDGRSRQHRHVGLRLSARIVSTQVTFGSLWFHGSRLARDRPSVTLDHRRGLASAACCGLSTRKSWTPVRPKRSTFGHMLRSWTCPGSALLRAPFTTVRGSDSVANHFPVEQVRGPPATGGDRPEDHQFPHQVSIVFSAGDRQTGRPR